LKLWAISDPHLSLGVANKEMHVFGEHWREHWKKIKFHWERTVSSEDVVILSGDISWGRNMDEAQADLDWLDRLPGTKVLFKGNHDRWWQGIHELRRHLPSSVFAVHLDHFAFGPWLIGGTRLWDTTEYNCDSLIEWSDAKGKTRSEPNDELYEKELLRLEQSLKTFRGIPGKRIGVCHFPPCDGQSHKSRALDCFAKAGVEHIVFGHLHSLKAENATKAFPAYKGIQLHLCSADWLDFKPKLIDERQE